MVKIHQGGRPGARMIEPGAKVSQRKRGQGRVAVRGAQSVRLRERPGRPWRPGADPGALQLLHPLLPDLEDYEIKLSVIFGTYNRRDLLQKCIDSIRTAAKGVSYEIIVADGGSGDGSREWLAGQHDVVLIEGDLSGAVRAFNSCFDRVRGRYILTLNDDAALVPTTIRQALPLFDDPAVGQIACQFQEDGVWKIERVHQLPYVNFGFVRTNVAKAIASICGGLWATCYQTYGGDTELSCWVRRLGYRVVESRAQVLHSEHKDELRFKNIRTDRRRTQFFHRWSSPEMMQFGGPPPKVQPHELAALKRIEMGESRQARWARLSSVDPELGQLPPRALLRPERVLHFHLWTPEDPQASLAASMAQLGSKGHQRIDWTTIPDRHERGRQLVEAAAALQPTLVFMQIQGANLDAAAVQALRQSVKDPSLVVISWSGDVGPGQGPWTGMGDRWAYDMWPQVDLMLFTGTGQVQLHRKRGMQNAAYLQIGYDTDRYFRGSQAPPSQHDVVFLGQDYRSRFDAIPNNDVQLRRDVVNAFRGSELRFGLFGPNWGASVMHQSRAGDAYRHSRMAISVSVTSKLARYSSDRLIRSMASGCPTLVKRFDDMEGWGLRHGVNCLVWDRPDEALALARQYLAKPQELEQIGVKGARLMLDSHTWPYRLKELSAILHTMRGQRWRRL